MTPPTSDTPDAHPESRAASSDDTSTRDGETGNVVDMGGAGRSPAAPDSSAETEARPPDEKTVGEPSAPKKSGRRWTILLLALLAISVAFNFLQAEQQRRTEARAAELDLALDRAMERIDRETGRAQVAEEALTEIDRSVDNVQERIADLQAALSKLSQATAR